MASLLHSERDVNTAMNTSRPRNVVVVAIVLFVLFAATGRYSNFYGTDAFTNAAQARAFAADQDPILEELDGLGTDPFRGTIGWFVDTPEGTTSQYPPGAAVWAVPFYLFDTSLDTLEVAPDDTSQNVTIAVPALAPATLAASLSVAIAMLFLGLTLRPFVSGRELVWSMAIASFGTAAWSVAADRLWQHGPAMMCISVGTYLTSRDRFAFAGLAFGAGILVRPHTAVIAACIGLGASIARRNVRPAAAMGMTSALGLALLVVYNNAVFDAASISGGYGGVFADRFVNDSPFVVVERLVLSLVHIRVGMLWTSPFLLIAFVAALRRWRAAPDWAIGAAIGGFVYLAIQLRANRVTGGAGFFSYRYPLEALMAAAPLLAIATVRWLGGGERRKRIFHVLVGLSFVAHGGAQIIF